MKKLLTLLIYGPLIAGGVLCLNIHDAEATKSYWTAFEKKYARPRSEQLRDAVLPEEVAAASCNLCHEGAKKKFNAYGLALRKAPRAEGKQRSKDERIRAAFEYAARMKTDPKDPGSPTFGKLLGQGKLPVEKISPDTDWYKKTKRDR